MDETCAVCEDAWQVYLHNDPERGPNLERHTYLYRCPACGTRYEVHPEGRAQPVAVTSDEADRLFPPGDP